MLPAGSAFGSEFCCDLFGVTNGGLMHLRVGRGVGLGGAAHLPESSDHGKNSHSKHCSSVLANDKPVDTLPPGFCPMYIKSNIKLQSIGIRQFLALPLSLQYGCLTIQVARLILNLDAGFPHAPSTVVLD